LIEIWTNYLRFRSCVSIHHSRIFIFSCECDLSLEETGFRDGFDESGWIEFDEQSVVGAGLESELSIFYGEQRLNLSNEGVLNYFVKSHDHFLNELPFVLVC